jgi:hypothetical protein
MPKKNKIGANYYRRWQYVDNDSQKLTGAAPQRGPTTAGAGSRW